MLACVKGAVLSGVEAVPVTVEVDLGNGLPSFTVVGLADASVQEARERVRAAIEHAGKEFPRTRIVVNLAPSNVRKQGVGLDLALALGVLAASEQAPVRGLHGRLFVGELGLGGEVRAVRGALASAEAGRRAGVKEVVCPAPNALEAALAGLPAIGVDTLQDALGLVRGSRRDPVVANPERELDVAGSSDLDLAFVRDQALAKRAVEVAAAGGHNMLMCGPPGAGKTLLARALPGVLPRLTLPEALEVTRIWSAAGLLPPGEALVRTRPFRSPHHGVSQAGMVGGGSTWTRPGEVTLAHRGVLFLDEFPEFPRSVLEALRQPLEDGFVTVTRARDTTVFPARFQLIAAMNPCPCGQFGSGPCRCGGPIRDRYRQRVSGPLLDRIDLHVDVPRVETEKLLEEPEAESSASVRERVERARRTALARGVTCNAEIPLRRLREVCALDGDANGVLAKSSRRRQLSARAVHRLLRMARTIADLEGSDDVSNTHVQEALNFAVDASGAS